MLKITVKFNVTMETLMKLRIEISTQWIRKQKTDKGLPLSRIVEFLRNEFGNDIACEEKSFSVFDVSFDCSVISQEKLIDTLKRFMRREFGVRDLSDVLTIADKDGLVSASAGDEEEIAAADGGTGGAPSASSNPFESLYSITKSVSGGDERVDNPDGEGIRGERSSEDEILCKADDSHFGSVG